MVIHTHCPTGQLGSALDTEKVYIKLRSQACLRAVPVDVSCDLESRLEGGMMSKPAHNTCLAAVTKHRGNCS